MTSPLILVIGGIRSGKSRHAEQIALRLHQRTDQKPLYIATWSQHMCAPDPQMLSRIRKHQLRRGTTWELVESGPDMALHLKTCLSRGITTLVDGMGTWLAGCLSCEKRYARERGHLLRVIDDNRNAPLILVSDEVGYGGVPASSMARNFADELGELNQELAYRAEQVDLVVVGMVQTLKSRHVNHSVAPGSADDPDR